MPFLMPGRDKGLAARAILYCVVPRALAPQLHDLLRRHFEGAGVEVVVERRDGDRRSSAQRRSAGPSEGGASRRTEATAERRLITDVAGRRVGDRRAPVVAVDSLSLPRRARAHAHQLVFLERVLPSDEHAEDLDTARLVSRIQSGDRDAFAELYLRYFDRVYGYLRVVLRDRHEAEDLTQQVFIRVLEALPSYQRRKQPFRAWLFVVARNHALDHLARRNRVELAEPDEIDRRREASGELGELEPLGWISDRELLMFVERLPLLQRQVLVARFMLGLRSDEVAAVLGTSSVSVRSAQKRALEALRTRFAVVRSAPRPTRRSYVRAGIRQSTVLRSRRFALRA
jgi:RNA polymerase sigma-70 factor (ECF subfamily)